MRSIALAVAVSLLASTALHAQAPAAAAPSAPSAPKPAPAAEQPPAPAPPPQEAYTYQPDGRRDPFLNLLGTGSDPAGGGRRGEGPSGMTVAEISVRGIMQSRGSLVAMIAGPDRKTYIVHQGDKLLDGSIKSITPQGLVFIQEVNDPLSLVKQREVSKLLHATESAK
jgi:type IV pilus assembly protein PilP